MDDRSASPAVTFDVPWTDSPLFEELLARAALSAGDEQLVRRFAADGVVVIDPALEDSLLDEIESELEQRHPALQRRGVGRVQDAWLDCPAVKRLATSESVLDVLHLLYQRAPIPFQTLNFEVGTQQRTHSDTIHFQTFPPNWMAGVWVALEDATERNGQLHYVPGSHRVAPLIDPTPLDTGEDDRTPYARYEDYVDMTIDGLGLQRVGIDVPRGHAVIWSANVMHGGSGIKDPSSTRRSQVTHYYFPGATYYTPINSDVFAGLIDFRCDELRDIRTGTPIPHVHRGRPFSPPTARPVRPGTNQASRRARAARLAEDYLLPPAAARRLRDGVRKRRAPRG